jgi:hypothetical protein
MRVGQDYSLRNLGIPGFMGTEIMVTAHQHQKILGEVVVEPGEPVVVDTAT